MKATAVSLVLGAQLRRLREEAGLTVEAVKDYLSCSPARIYSIELGYRKISQAELFALLDPFYSRPDLIESMERLRTAAEKTDDGPVEDPLALYPNTMLVHELEALSATVHGVVLDQIPRLCQIPEYMERQHVIAGYSAASIEKLVAAGLVRQNRFFSADTGPLTHIIFTESALDRASRIPNQIPLLLERAEHDRLKLHLIPNSVGPHPCLSSYTVLHVDKLPQILYLDTINGGVSLLDNPDDAEVAMDRWLQLRALALDEDETREYISQRVES